MSLVSTIASVVHIKSELSDFMTSVTCPIFLAGFFPLIPKMWVAENERGNHSSLAACSDINVDILPESTKHLHV